MVWTLQQITYSRKRPSPSAVLGTNWYLDGLESGSKVLLILTVLKDKNTPGLL